MNKPILSLLEYFQNFKKFKNILNKRDWMEIYFLEQKVEYLFLKQLDVSGQKNQIRVISGYPKNYFQDLI